MVVTSWVFNYLSQYLPSATKDATERARPRSAQRTTSSWVVIESPAQTPGLPIPSDADDHATALSLVRWRGGTRSVERLANCHPHGYWMHWHGGSGG